jgi:hypothetical protein
MKEIEYAAGETIYAEGDPNECAYIIASGTVDVLRDAGNTTVPLALLGPGHIFGEVGVIRNRPRSTTARAASDVILLAITRQDFDAAFGEKNRLALTLLRMLCERLSEANQRIYEGQLHEAGAATFEVTEIRLLPGSPAVESQIGDDGVVIEKLPFRVGRRAIAGDPSTQGSAELLLRTTKAFEMAPQHFVIEEEHGRLLIRDLGSVLGTLVNGIRIAQFEESDSVPLKMGVTEIQVGGLDSSIQFNLAVKGR